MDTVSLSAGLQSLFGTSQSTFSYMPTLDANGAPNGKITPGDLASVLGGSCLGSTPDINIDSLSGTGFAYVTSPYSPTELEGWLYQQQPRNNGTLNERTKIQIFRPYNSSETYTRQLNWDSQTWTSWTRIDNFGCNTLSALATALGEQLGIIYDYFASSQVAYKDYVFGYGVIILANVGIGRTDVLCTTSYETTKIVDGGTGFVVSKNSEYSTRIEGNGINGVYVLFISVASNS